MDYRRIIEEEAGKDGIRAYHQDRWAQYCRTHIGRKIVFIHRPLRVPSFFTGLEIIAEKVREVFEHGIKKNDRMVVKVAEEAELWRVQRVLWVVG